MLHVQWWVWPWCWLNGQSMVAAWQPGGVALGRQAMRMVDDQQIWRSFGAFQKCTQATCALGINAAACKIAQQSTGEREAGRRSSVVQRAVGGRQREVQADLGGVKRNAAVFRFSFLWVGA